MIEKLLNLLLTVIIACQFTACKDTDEPSPVPKPGEPVERTVLVYMVADNNLGSYNQLNRADLNEMVKGAADGGLNGGRLLVYHNRPGTDRGNVPLLIEVTKQGLDTLKTYPDTPDIYSVEADRMREVLSDMKEYAPASDYGLVFWGHATAWMTHGSYDIDSRTSAPVKRSYGSDRNKWMPLSSMRKALDGEYFSFIYFDCCLMGTVEIAYEFRHNTPYIVASPTELEGEGMPYHLNLPAFFASEKPDVVAMATNTFEYYNLRSGNYSCQMTVIDTSALDKLADATREIYLTQTDFPPRLWFVQELSKSHLRFFGNTLDTPGCNDCHPVYDMEAYMEVLTANRPDLLEAWRSALDATVVYKATTSREFTGISIDRYCGLGSYIVRLGNHGDYHGCAHTLWWNDVVSKAPVLNN